MISVVAREEGRWEVDEELDDRKVAWQIEMKEEIRMKEEHRMTLSFFMLSCMLLSLVAYPPYNCLHPLMGF